MSLTVNSRPATWAGTSGPIIYKMTTTDHANAGYYLLVEIWNSTTGLKIGSQKCYPNSGGLLSVRVESILRSNMSLDNNSDLTTGDSVYLDGNWIKYYIKYNQYWTGSSPALIDDVANLRYAIYGGLQIGVINDMTLYVDGLHKLLTLNSIPNAIYNYPFLIESIFNTTGDYVVSRYLRGVELDVNYYAVASVGVNRLKLKETGTADNLSIWKQGTTVPAFVSGTGTNNASTWESVAYGNGVYVAVASSGANRVMRSTDGGITWVVSVVTLTPWSCVAFGNGLFVVMSSDGFNGSITSPDGITWTTQTQLATLSGNAWKFIIFAGGQFVATGDSASTPNTSVITSHDGIAWTQRTTPVDDDFLGIAYGNGTYVVLGRNYCITSPDGIIWTSRTIVAASWKSVAFGAGLFVAVTDTGFGAIAMSSPDGIVWASRVSASDQVWESVTYFSGLFIAVASTGTAAQRGMKSKNGITWTAITTTAANDWQCIIAAQYGSLAGIFVAVSNTGAGNRAMKIQIMGSEFKIVNIQSELSNTIMLQWKDSLGGDGCHPFTYNQEYFYTNSDGKKSKRMILYANGLTPSQWDAIQGCKSVGDVYRIPINELTTSLNRTVGRIGQSVYVLNSDGTKTGVIVIPNSDSSFTKKTIHETTVEIEFPELFLQ